LDDKDSALYTDDDIRKDFDELRSKLVEVMFGTNLLQKGAFFNVDSYLDIPINEILFLSEVSSNVASKLNIEDKEDITRKSR
jgi:hypothetical protein